MEILSCVLIVSNHLELLEEFVHLSSAALSALSESVTAGIEFNVVEATIGLKHMRAQAEYVIP